MGKNKSKIALSGIQIKSLKKAKMLCGAINTIEVECGVGNVEIVLKDVFVCKWINLKKLNNTEMEKLIRGIIE